MWHPLHFSIWEGSVTHDCQIEQNATVVGLVGKEWDWKFNPTISAFYPPIQGSIPLFCSYNIIPLLLFSSSPSATLSLLSASQGQNIIIILYFPSYSTLHINHHHPTHPSSVTDSLQPKKKYTILHNAQLLWFALILAYGAKLIRLELMAWWWFCDGSQATIAQSVRAKQIWGSSLVAERLPK